MFPHEPHISRPAVLFLLDWQPTSWSTREEYFCQLSARLNGQGITPLLTVSDEIPRETRERFEEAGAQVSGCSFHQPLRYWTYLRRQACRYDILLVQVRFFNYFSLLLWMCRFSGITRIMFTEANGGEWSDHGDWRTMLVRFRAALASRPVQKYIAISEFVKTRLLALGLPEDRICVVYNGIDINRYRPDAEKRQSLEKDFSGGSATLFMLFASEFVEVKRPDLALRVCGELVKRGIAVRLLMAGSGPMRTSLEALTVELGIQEYVSWLGHCKNLQCVLQGVDIFLHTTKGEAFGNVLVEAMACGIPVVATRSGAAPEVIDHGVTGLLVDQGDFEAERTANAVQSLWENPEQRAMMGQAGVERAARFTVEACVQKTLAVYSEVTEERIQPV
jgi:glycosyltransferase involved in cell wall biosynthesis